MPKSGFAFDGTGRVDRVDTYTTKNNKDIITVVLQTEGSYPQLVPIKFFGRLADEAAALKRGDVLTVTGRLGGREWHGKVYADVVGESIELVAGASEGERAGQPAGGTGRGWGAAQQPQQQSFQGQSPLPEDDDVPF